MKRKKKIAFISLTSCEGCQISLLDLREKFFDFLKKVNLANLDLIEDEPFPKGKLDITFVEGLPITKGDIEILKKARKNSKILVALGACAVLGGIPEMKNYHGREKTIRYIYKNLLKVSNPEIKEINKFVKVDFYIPGCPISGEEFLKLVQELIEGKIPQIPQRPVCIECKKRGRKDCFLNKKIICLGSIILGGCGAVCPNNNFPCWGCRGFLKNVNIKKFLKNLIKLGISKKREEEILEIFGLKDQIN